MDLSLIDTSALSEVEQMQLAPFYLAYAPHSPIPGRAVLKVEGEGTYFPQVDTLAEVKHQARMLDKMYYHFLETVTRDEHGNIIDEEVEAKSMEKPGRGARGRKWRKDEDKK